jgi:hypothetical protein
MIPRWGVPAPARVPVQIIILCFVEQAVAHVARVWKVLNISEITPVLAAVDP